MPWGRVIPAVLLGPALLWAATRDVVPAYLVVVALCALVGSGELYVLLVRAGYRPLWALGCPLAAAVALDAGLLGWQLFPHLVTVSALAALLWLTFGPPRPEALAGWGLTLVPAIYVGGLLGYWILLRGLPHGAHWAPLTLAVTWAADIAAYAAGRRWGRTKLAPSISPGKSVEGTIAGVTGAVLVAVAVGTWMPVAGQPLLVYVGLGILTAITGLAGDLAESFIKRQLGAKDASRLLMGHGGLLDRLDSLLATGMVAYLYLVAVGG
jgi:phosphatidate cytidylyltransferase